MRQPKLRVKTFVKSVCFLCVCVCKSVSGASLMFVPFVIGMTNLYINEANIFRFSVYNGYNYFLWSLPVIHRNLNVQLLHEKAHDIITLAIYFQYGQIIFWCPLQQKHDHTITQQHYVFIVFQIHSSYSYKMSKLNIPGG